MPSGHEGHRERVRARLHAEGLDSFQPHEIIELLLFYVIPQKNVNELAHTLINRFGSVRGVLYADPDELIQVSGVGERTIQHFRMLAEGLELYRNFSMPPRPCLNRLRKLVAYVHEWHPNPAGDIDLLLCLDAGGCLIHSVPLPSLQISATNFRFLMNAALLHHSYSLAMVSWRADGRLTFTESEIQFSQQCFKIMYGVSITLEDHVLLRGSRYTSMRRESLLSPIPHVLREESMHAMDDWLQ